MGVIRCTRLATALGNFEQGSIQTESAAVAHWLTSGLKVAMSRVGYLLSPRYALTKLPGDMLKIFTTMAIPAKKIINMVLLHIRRTGGTSSADGCLETGDPTFRGTLERHKQTLKEQLGGSAETTPMLEIKPGVRPLPQAGAAPHRQLVPLTAASLPRRLLRTGGGSKGHSAAAQVRCLTGLTSFLKEVALAIFFICFAVGAACNRDPVAATIFWLKVVE